ncbi:MAG: hypothetical protein A4E68_00965 [Syntrophaceae bacterium PtaB.Bin095]|nr:MAG: hypothetical protein A4E68_00965 [Syntrophaceae bacterium PtaB.Bin095]
MKTNIFVSALVTAVLIAIAGIGAYFILPRLIQENTSDLNLQIKQANERLQKIEGSIAVSEQASKEGQLKIGADAQTIVNMVNRQISRIDALSVQTKGDIKRIDDEMTRQKNRIEKGLKEQEETAKKIDDATKSLAQTAQFRGLLANIKRQILKVRLEISDKNIGNAKNELNLIDARFGQASALTSAQEKTTLKELHQMLQKVRADLDTNLASAANRLDLLWHELEKVPEQP